MASDLFTIEKLVTRKVSHRDDTLKAFVQHGTVLPIPFEDLKQRALALVANWRWRKEVAGLTLANGIKVPTDDTAQRKVSELRRRAEAGEIALPFGFKASNGWVDVDLVTIQYIDQTVAAHVQHCYAQEHYWADRLRVCTTAAQVRAVLTELAAEA